MKEDFNPCSLLLRPSIASFHQCQAICNVKMVLRLQFWIILDLGLFDTKLKITLFCQASFRKRILTLASALSDHQLPRTISVKPMAGNTQVQPSPPSRLTLWKYICVYKTRKMPYFLDLLCGNTSVFTKHKRCHTFYQTYSVEIHLRFQLD